MIKLRRRVLKYTLHRLPVGRWVASISPSFYQVCSTFYQRVDVPFRTSSPQSPEALAHALKKAKELKGNSVGDYYEFGVFQGYSFWVAQKLCRDLQITDASFYGFDSFQGLPDVEGVDKVSGYHRGQHACSRALVTKNLTKHGVDWSKTALIEGFYEDSLTEDLKKQYPFKKVGVTFINCDLYSSARHALDWLGSLLEENSIILLGDKFSRAGSPDRGVMRAFSEFMDQNPQFQAERFGVFGSIRGFFLHKCQVGIGD